MKPIGFALVLALSPTVFAQRPAITGQGGIVALRGFALDMEKCQDTFVTERHWGKTPLEIERVYLGRPKNITWRPAQVSHGVGYVEFSSSVYVRVPKETAKKYARKRVVQTADLPITSEGVAFVPAADGFPIPETQYRYEFELLSEGIQLVKISRTSPDRVWETVQTGHPCAPHPAGRLP